MSAIFIFTILADSCYSRKQVKNGVLFSATSKNKRLILILYKNIDIPPKSPFGKGGLGRFAPGAKIKRVSWLRSTANAVKAIDYRCPAVGTLFFCKVVNYFIIITIFAQNLKSTQVKKFLSIFLALALVVACNTGEDIPTVDNPDPIPGASDTVTSINAKIEGSTRASLVVEGDGEEAIEALYAFLKKEVL